MIATKLQVYNKQAVQLTSEANNGLNNKIRTHPTTSFFVFAFLISWTAWFLAPVIAHNDTALSNLIDLIAAFGPALSAILVSAILQPDPSGASTKKRWITFTVVFAVTYIAQTVALLFVTLDFTLETAATAAATSFLAAYVISSIYHPRRGVAHLMAGLKRVSPKSIWVWVAFLLPFIWQIIDLAIDSSFGGNELANFTFGTLLAVAVSYPITFFFGGPLNEEPGWRGFATPRLQERFTPLTAGLIIGLIWSFWHFPLHVTAFYGDGVPGFLFRFIYTVPFGVLFTWLYNRSKGNLFACILLHASINTSSGFFGANSGLIAILVMIAFTVGVVFYDKMYKKTKSLQEQTSNSPSKTQFN